MTPFFSRSSMSRASMAFYSYWDDRVTAALAGTGREADLSPFAFGSRPGNYAVTGRLTCLAVLRRTRAAAACTWELVTPTADGQQQLLCRQPPPGPRRCRLAARAQLLYTGSFFTPIRYKS